MPTQTHPTETETEFDDPRQPTQYNPDDIATDGEAA
jgi:hypothetical protein